MGRILLLRSGSSLLLKTRASLDAAVEALFELVQLTATILYPRAVSNRVLFDDEIDFATESDPLDWTTRHDLWRSAAAAPCPHARDIVVPRYKNRAPIRITTLVLPHVRDRLIVSGWQGALYVRSREAPLVA